MELLSLSARFAHEFVAFPTFFLTCSIAIIDFCLNVVVVDTRILTSGAYKGGWFLAMMTTCGWLVRGVGCGHRRRIDCLIARLEIHVLYIEKRNDFEALSVVLRI